jgi:hypothetical protein
MYYAHLLMIQRRRAEALIQSKFGWELDSLKPIVLGLHAMVMRNTSDFKSAIKHFIGHFHLILRTGLRKEIL